MTNGENTLQTGIEAIRRGDKETARAAFRRVLQDDPDNVQALLWLAGIAATRDEKQQVLERVLQLDPDNALAQKGLDALGAAPAATPDTRAQVYDADSTAEQPQPTDEPARSPRQRRRAALAGAAAASATPVERDTIVLGERHGDEEEGPSGGWLWWALPTLALFVVAFGAWWVWERGNTPLVATNTPPPVAETTTAEPNAVITDTAQTPVAAYPGPDVGATDEVVELPESVDVTATTTINIPNIQVDAGAGGAASAAPSPTPNASPDAPNASPSSSPAPNRSPAASPQPGASPSAAPSPSPPAVATRPTVIDPEQRLSAGAWEWSYYGLSNVTTGRDYQAQPANGRYLIVLLLVRNTTGAPAQIPDGLFVVTDEQGRTATFNREASVEYMRRYGVGTAGDYPANAEIPPTNSPVSVPVLFDVAPDATNLVVSTSADPTQGYLVRQNMQ